MDKKRLDIKNLKEIAEEAGHVAVGLGIMAGEKAEPVAEKIGEGIKKIAKSESKNEVKSDGIKPEKLQEIPESDSPFDASKTLNSVIEGAYLNCVVNDKKGILFAGDKEISRMNCESYEICTSSEVVDKIKESFADYRKHCINPLQRFSVEKYIIINWRNGEKSVVCVDSSKFDRIIKLLS